MIRLLIILIVKIFYRVKTNDLKLTVLKFAMSDYNYIDLVVKYYDY